MEGSNSSSISWKERDKLNKLMTDEFLVYCEENHLPYKGENDNGLFNSHEQTIFSEYFEYFCGNGFFDTVKEFYKRFKDYIIKDPNNDCLQSGFNAASMRGDIEIMTWIYEIAKEHNLELFMCIFNGCLFNHLDVVKWIYDKSGNTIQYGKGHESLEKFSDHVFFVSCDGFGGRKGNELWLEGSESRIELVRWLNGILKCSDNGKRDILNHLFNNMKMFRGEKLGTNSLELAKFLIEELHWYHPNLDDVMKLFGYVGYIYETKNTTEKTQDVVSNIVKWLEVMTKEFQDFANYIKEYSNV